MEQFYVTIFLFLMTVGLVYSIHRTGAQPALHFGGGNFVNVIRWCQRAYSTMVQFFRKRSQI